MSLSERILQAGATDSPPVRRLPTPIVDGLAEFKVKVANQLFERLGQRLFESSDEEQLYALVLSEISGDHGRQPHRLSPPKNAANSHWRSPATSWASAPSRSSSPIRRSAR